MILENIAALRRRLVPVVLLEPSRRRELHRAAIAQLVNLLEPSRLPYAPTVQLVNTVERKRHLVSNAPWATTKILSRSKRVKAAVPVIMHLALE